MPEGDSVAGHAEQLGRRLIGRRITKVAGTSPSVRANSSRVLDSTVDDVRAIGKHLLIDLSGGYSVHVHLGMNGRWDIGDLGRPTHGSARLVVQTEDSQAALYSAPTVEVGRTPAIEAELERLGPDLLGEFDPGEFLRRARVDPERALGEVLLDQRVAAGIGNVYKSELAFLERVNPYTAVGNVDDATLLAIADRAVELLSLNVGRRRSTTGSPRRGQETWVYGQAGQGCRRCGTRIEMGDLAGRVTYWCPRCQPHPGGR